MLVCVSADGINGLYVRRFRNNSLSGTVTNTLSKELLAIHMYVSACCIVYKVTPLTLGDAKYDAFRFDNSISGTIPESIFTVDMKSLAHLQVNNNR